MLQTKSWIFRIFAGESLVRPISLPNFLAWPPREQYRDEGCTALGKLFKGGNSSNRLSQNQSVDIVGTFVGMDRFEINHVPENWVLCHDAICTGDVASSAGHIKSHLHVVALGHRNLNKARPMVIC